jgi:small-conductance mechanosensitive channel
MIASAGILGLALAFAFQILQQTSCLGFSFLLGNLRVGDIIKIKDYMGKVKK